MSDSQRDELQRMFPQIDNDFLKEMLLSHELHQIIELLLVTGGPEHKSEKSRIHADALIAQGMSNQGAQQEVLNSISKIPNKETRFQRRFSMARRKTTSYTELEE